MKKIVHYLTRWQVQLVFLLIQVVVSLFGFYNYFFNFNLSEKFLTQQALENERVLVKSGVKSIDTYLNNIANQLFILESNDIVDQLDLNKVRVAFRDFINRLDPSVRDIARYDKSGKLIVIENREGVYAGENDNFSDKDFIQWSKTEGNKNKIFISAPYVARAGSARGEVIIAIVTPAYLGNSYEGTIVMRVLLNEFKKQFIDPLGSSDEESLIMDLNGTIFAGKNSLANQNFFSYAEKTRWEGWQDFSSKLKEAIAKEEGVTDWQVMYPNEGKKDMLVAYSKIDVPYADNNLILFVTRNKPNILSSLSPFFEYGTLWLGGSIVLTFLIGLVLTFIKRVIV